MQASIEDLIMTKADRGDITSAAKLQADLEDSQQQAAQRLKVGCFFYLFPEN